MVKTFLKKRFMFKCLPSFKSYFAKLIDDFNFEAVTEKR